MSQQQGYPPLPPGGWTMSQTGMSGDVEFSYANAMQTRPTTNQFQYQ